MKVKKPLLGTWIILHQGWLRREEGKRIRTLKQPLADNPPGLTPAFVLFPSSPSCSHPLSVMQACFHTDCLAFEHTSKTVQEHFKSLWPVLLAARPK